MKKIKTVIVKKVPNRTDQHVGSCVRMRRMALGKSQSWLANGVGLTFQQIQKYEKGTNRIGSSRLQQFANLLDVPISFFFEEAPGGPSRTKVKVADPLVDGVSKFVSSSDGMALIKAFNAYQRCQTEAGHRQFC